LDRLGDVTATSHFLQILISLRIPEELSRENQWASAEERKMRLKR